MEQREVDQLSPAGEWDTETIGLQIDRAEHAFTQNNGYVGCQSHSLLELNE
ncbi:hypothetical protein KIN20_015627 [Parelaphostrongylus tenuis]|uniref:Uncharacterized protein n=1 Tax=Parelaphostrongylus tenuis TaxID=148309 RepID=A0AAD5MF81_PARTN|nr:hypothetical protein KIN20_015627 [Parelaphostrongylus tenuis]